ncbi:MAG: helix-turn-helix domain-containing protein [Actinomycetota bacterium]
MSPPARTADDDSAPDFLTVEEAAAVLRIGRTTADELVREFLQTGALPGVLAIIDDDDVFPTVTIDPVARTVAWPAGVDFDPDVLHGDQTPASGTGPKLLREYHREPARSRLPLPRQIALAEPDH